MDHRRIWVGQLEREILGLLGPPGAEEPNLPDASKYSAPRRLKFAKHGPGFRFWVDVAPGAQGPVVTGWKQGSEGTVGLVPAEPPPPATQAAPEQSKVGRVLAVLIVVAAIGGVAYFLFGGDEPNRPTIPPPTNVPTGRPKIGH